MYTLGDAHFSSCDIYKVNAGHCGASVSECLYICTVYRENVAGIKFGEMAKNGYKLILVRFKFGDLYWRMT